MSQESANLILDAMLEKAKQLGAKGVGLVIVYDVRKEGFRLYPVMEAVGTPILTTPGRPSVDLWAMAWSLMGQMLLDETDSGYREEGLRVGEWGYRGGLIHHDGPRTIFAVFYGGFQSRDVEIARSGIEAYTQK